MKRLVILITLFLVILSIISCSKQASKTDKPFYLTVQVSIAGTEHHPNWYLRFNAKKHICPYKAILKVDNKEFEINLDDIIMTDGLYESFTLNIKSDLKEPDISEYGYMAAPGVSKSFSDYSKDSDLYTTRKETMADSLFSSMIKANTVIMDIKGKTGNATYTISKSDIDKLKVTYDWSKLF